MGPGTMMRRFRRLLAGCLLGHFASATLVIPIAHAALADDRPLRAAHVEQLGDKNCPPIHNHLNCSFSSARLLPAPPRAAAPAPADRIQSVRRAIDSLGRPLPAIVCSLGSRAPPST